MTSRTWLMRTAMVWFVVCCLGQTFFLTYIVGFYAPTFVTGRLEGWNEFRNFIDSYVKGDFWGNVQFGVHVIMAAILTFGGMAQLWPALRNRFRVFHRWNGRVYMVAALVGALGGLWLTWVRGSQTDPVGAIAVSINGVLILWFLVMAWRKAIARKFAEHERWAMRTFFAVSGVWSLRVGIMGFGLIVNTLGLPKALMAPAFTFFGFASYLIPLALYEAYCWAKRSENPKVHLGFAAALGMTTALTALGIVGAAMVFWLPPLIGRYG